jgi:hypothetical protein
MRVTIQAHTDAGSAGDAAGLARGGAAGGAIPIRAAAAGQRPPCLHRAPRVRARAPRPPSCGLWRCARRPRRRTKGSSAARGAPGAPRLQRPRPQAPPARAPCHPRSAMRCLPSARAAGWAPGGQQPRSAFCRRQRCARPFTGHQPAGRAAARLAPAGGGGPAQLERRGRGLLAGRGVRRAPA